MTPHSEGITPAPALLAPADPASVETPPVPRPAAFIPFSQSRLALLSIDPFLAFAYWSAQPLALVAARKRIEDPNAGLALRFHEVASIDFDGRNANQTFDVDIAEECGNYYLRLSSPAQTLVAELGVKGANGRFGAVARSNLLSLPRDGESPRYEDRRRRVAGIASPLWQPRSRWPLEVRRPGVAEAALAEEEYLLEGAASGSRHPSTPSRSASGPGPAVEDAALPSSRLPEAPGGVPPLLAPSGGMGIGISSLEWAGPAGVSSLERPLPAAQPHLEVKADVVIHGRAPAGSEVVIDGVPVRVRADGTFDLRLALPQSPSSRPTGAGAARQPPPPSPAARDRHEARRADAARERKP